MKHQKVEQRNECIDYFKKCSVWKRVFTGFRDKYLSYGRFAGKIVIKSFQLKKLKSWKDFSDRIFMVREVLPYQRRNLQKLWQTAGLKKYSTGDPYGVFWNAFVCKGGNKGNAWSRRSTEIEGEV